MVSETSLAAQQCRLREWAEQIRDCQNRAEGISIIREEDMAGLPVIKIEHTMTEEQLSATFGGERI